VPRGARRSESVAGRTCGMEIAERVVEGVTVLDLKGKMTLGEGDELLKDKINSLLANSRKNLSITKLLTVFETFDTEAEAIKSFSG
jgi:hypothetical protein